MVALDGGTFVSYTSKFTVPHVPRGFQEVKVARFRENGPGFW